MDPSDPDEFWDMPNDVDTIDEILYGCCQWPSPTTTSESDSGEDVLPSDPALPGGRNVSEAPKPAAKPDMTGRRSGCFCGPNPPAQFRFKPFFVHQFSVRTRLADILGLEPTQAELLALRTGLFRGIMPPPSREEKRNREANLRAFEFYASALAGRLFDPRCCTAIVNLAYHLRKSKAARQKIVEHAFSP